VSYVAFDTAAGVVIGVLVQAAHAGSAPDAWRPPIQAIWDHAIIGGSSDGTPALAVIGTMAWLVGTAGRCRRVPTRAPFMVGDSRATRLGVRTVRLPHARMARRSGHLRRPRRGCSGDVIGRPEPGGRQTRRVGVRGRTISAGCK
jgi:hypothetical protein